MDSKAAMHYGRSDISSARLVPGPDQMAGLFVLRAELRELGAPGGFATRPVRLTRED
ncbi:hypothetical protein HKCCE3408_08605 [Rhodobacterales bacterium HKCCE3408]|nr:hypothetical protein [Rhodobacterales bacterium HKCCE3408]